uniref:S-adenosyl-L-methionine-dependent methyltransferase n=1 Tax=Ananas comosus var. bracteatus TaxID=296719 RepID=A0A6V7NUN0_ANACO|nr:unnamed protein product [Ananas comosus var. bracteatus]
MSAQLIVEVSSEASQSTIALAAAARQTGGRLVCILPEEESLAASREVINESGLDDMVEFKVGNATELLPEYENIDFSLVDCKTNSYKDLLKLLDVNPEKSVVVANNLTEGREGLCGDVGKVRDGAAVRSVKHPIGEGIEVTMIGKSDEFGITDWKRSGGGGANKGKEKRMVGRGKSKWVRKFDEESGEEHIFRLPKSI